MSERNRCDKTGCEAEVWGITAITLLGICRVHLCDRHRRAAERDPLIQAAWQAMDASIIELNSMGRAAANIHADLKAFENMTWRYAQQRREARKLVLLWLDTPDPKDTTDGDGERSCDDESARH